MFYKYLAFSDPIFNTHRMCQEIIANKDFRRVHILSGKDENLTFWIYSTIIFYEQGDYLVVEKVKT